MQKLSMKNYSGVLRSRARFENRLWKRAAKRGKRWAAALRMQATPGEQRTMLVLKDIGFKFEFQQEFLFASNPRTRIVDFWLPENFIAIEIDGRDHLTKRGLLRDQERDLQFKDEYPHVQFLRYTNEEVMADDFRAKLERQVKARITESA